MKITSIILIGLILAAIFPEINKIGDFEEAGESLAGKILRLNNSEDASQLADSTRNVCYQAQFVISNLRTKIAIMSVLSLALFFCMKKRHASGSVERPSEKLDNHALQDKLKTSLQPQENSDIKRGNSNHHIP